MKYLVSHQMPGDTINPEVVDLGTFQKARAAVDAIWTASARQGVFAGRSVQILKKLRENRYFDVRLPDGSIVFCNVEVR